jgi:hypothetical protein
VTNTHCQTEPAPHRRDAEHGSKAIRLVDPQMVHDVSTMLTNVARPERIWKSFVERAKDARGLERAVRHSIPPQATERRDFTPRGCDIGRERGLNRSKCDRGIRHHRVRHRVVSSDEPRIAIDVERRVGAPNGKGPSVGGKITETRANNQNNVRPRREVLRRRRVTTETNDPEMKAMRLWEDSFSMCGRHHRCSYPLRELAELTGGSPRAVSDDDERTRRALERAGNPRTSGCVDHAIGAAVE